MSSRRNTKAPPVWRAHSQLKSADRMTPMCAKPVGLGAKRTRAGCGPAAALGRLAVADGAGATLDEGIGFVLDMGSSLRHSWATYKR